MGWIYRDADQHKCEKPGYDSKMRRGDIWQCDTCKKKYKVINYRAGHYDQRDGWWGGHVEWQEFDNYPGVTSWRDR